MTDVFGSIVDEGGRAEGEAEVAFFRSSVNSDDFQAAVTGDLNPSVNSLLLY